MKPNLILMTGLCIFGFAGPSYAQMSDYENSLIGQSMEARVGVTIPFGGDGKSKKSKPQIDFMTRRTQSDRTSVDWAMKPGLVRNDYVETRMSLTLSAEPELRLNGQEIYDFGGEQADVSDGVKTAGKVALGAGLVVLAAAVVLVGVIAITYDSDDDY